MLIDPWLSPFKDSLRNRYSLAQKWIKTLNEHEGGLEGFGRGHERFGLHVQGNGDIVYREWAPNATQAFLTGEFSKIKVSETSNKTQTYMAQIAGIASRIP